MKGMIQFFHRVAVHSLLLDLMLAVGLIGAVVLIPATVSAESTVRGTAAYRERMALPPQAVFEATLQDVSKADAPAEVVGHVRIENPGQPPIHFQIPYNPARIKAMHTYSVLARIMIGKRLLFTTDQAYLVLTRSYGSEVALMLRRVGGSKPASKPATDNPVGNLPASFLGELPCADCEGIRYTLNLFPDSVFFLRTTYRGKGKGEGDSFDDIGQWTLSADRNTLILHAGRETSVMFAVKSPVVLRKLDIHGKEIESQLNYDLIRSNRFEWIEPRLRLRGMYMYMADAGLLRECLTERRFPVAQEGDNVALERAYLKARRQPGEQLLLTLEGQIALRPKMEGLGDQEVLVVKRFIDVWPGETCGPRFSTAQLENTYWKLVRLGDQPVQVAAQQREPHLILRADGHRVGGSGGCNRFVGRYELEGKTLRFVGMAMTRMACREGMEQEQDFLNALDSTARWKILGEHLELYGACGELRARFESRDMK